MEEREKKLQFSSDYHCATHPAVVEAVIKASLDRRGRRYGEDVISQQAQECLRQLFGDEVYVFFVGNGSAANQLALTTLLDHPYQSVVCTDVAHINVHECGALECYGHKIHTVSNKDGKLCVDQLVGFLAQRNDIHRADPRVISLSNATEMGTVYSLQELRAIGDWAKHHDFRLHIDGVRLANAAVALDVSDLAQLTLDVGADAISLGATKIGGMLGDAVLFRNPELAQKAVRLHKQHAQLCARHHCLAAQFTALYSDGHWRENAAQANQMAALLAYRCRQELGLIPIVPFESNVLFVKLPPGKIPPLQAEADFYVWDQQEGIVRWMCSWDTTEEDVNQFMILLHKVFGQ